MTNSIDAPKTSDPLRIGVLGSTRGTAMQGILDALRRRELPGVELALVVADKPNAPILDRAAQHDIDNLFLNPKGLEREMFDAEVTSAFEEAGVDLILMIGYMRIVSREFIEDWRGRLLNVHPSLLPAFAGLMNRQVTKPSSPPASPKPAAPSTRSPKTWTPADRAAKTLPCPGRRYSRKLKGSRPGTRATGLRRSSAKLAAGMNVVSCTF